MCCCFDTFHLSLTACLFLTHFAINKKQTTVVYGVFFLPASQYPFKEHKYSFYICIEAPAKWIKNIYMNKRAVQQNIIKIACQNMRKRQYVCIENSWMVIDFIWLALVLLQLLNSFTFRMQYANTIIER